MADDAKKDNKDAGKDGSAANAVVNSNSSVDKDRNGAGDAQASDAFSKVMAKFLGEDPAKIWKKRYDMSKKAPKESKGPSGKTPDAIIKASISQGGKTIYGDSHNAQIAAVTTPTHLYGVGGMPAVFLQNTDPPSSLNPNGIGGYWLRHHVSYGQFIIFQPGYISWGISAAVAKDIVSNPANIGGTLAKMFTGELITFNPQVDTFFFDVERACRIAMHLMGVAYSVVQLPIQGSSTIKSHADRINNQYIQHDDLGTKASFRLGDLKRPQYRNIGLEFSSLIALKDGKAMYSTSNGKTTAQDIGIVSFFVNGNIEASTALTSSTASNPLKEALEGLMGNDTSNALKVLLGKTGSQGMDFGNEAIAYFTGNPLMPQVWQASSFEKSFTANFRFSSHDGHPVAIFMNVVYPLIKLLLLAMPLGVGGFQTSPPLVRAYATGVFNIEYGMITSINIRKNMEALTDTQLPTEVDVTIQISDLNPFLYKERPGWFKKSVGLGTGFSNFIGSLIGINMVVLTEARRNEFFKAMVAIDSDDSTHEGLFEDIKYNIINLYNKWYAGAVNTYDNYGSKIASTHSVFAQWYGGSAATEQTARELGDRGDIWGGNINGSGRKGSEYNTNNGRGNGVISLKGNK